MFSGLRPVTVVLAALATAVSIARLTGHTIEFGPWFGAYGAHTSREIWNGAWWGLLTSVFPHGGAFHLLFNLYWLWMFGSVLEDRLGSAWFAALAVVAAGTGSAFQLLATDQTGIGLSGVGYGLFGYAWVRSRFDAEYQLDPSVVKLFVAWFFIAIVLDDAGVMPIANWAHGGGAVAGAAIAVAFHGRPRLAQLGGVVGLGLCAASVQMALIWVPWSPAWLFDRALEHQLADEFEDALDLYDRMLERAPDTPEALHNRGMVREELGDFEGADADFRRANALDHTMGN